MELLDREVNRLINLKKRFEKSGSSEPDLLESLSKIKLRFNFKSLDLKDDFLISFERKGISLEKVTNNLMAYKTIPLLRLDLGGNPHRNPDGEEINCPHIHIYKEGFGDRWAKPLDLNSFKNLDNIILTFYDFLNYCNAKDFPKLENRLF